MGLLAMIFGTCKKVDVKPVPKPVPEYGIELIKHFEGFKPNPYVCPAGKWTRGYGSTILAGGAPVVHNSPKADEQTAEKDVRWYCDKKIIPVLKKKGCYDRLNFNQRSALISFCYNVGENSFACSTLCKMVAKDAYDERIPNEFTKWDKYTNPKTGKKESLRGLTVRRAAEAQLYME